MAKRFGGPILEELKPYRDVAQGCSGGAGGGEAASGNGPTFLHLVNIWEGNKGLEERCFLRDILCKSSPGGTRNTRRN